MRKYRPLVNYLIVATLLLFAPISEAVIFGDIKVYSFLDEPLNAELEVTDLNGVDPNMLIASLGDANDFVRANLARPFFLTTLTFNVVTYQDRVFVSIQSSKVVKTPYLEFLIDFEWPTGSFIKDYTVLLDPPPNNFNFATRPVPFSALAEKQTSQKLFPSDVKRMQDQQAQAKAAAAAAAAPNTMPQGITDPTATQTPATQQQLPQATNTQQPTQPVQTVPQQPVAQDPQATMPQTIPQAIPPQKTQFQKQIDQNTAQANKNKMLLEELIDDAKEIDEMVGVTADLDHLAGARQKHLEMYKDIDGNSDLEIDFGDVIKPGAAQPNAPVLPGSKIPAPTAVPAQQHTSGGWMLLLAGFLLGAVVVVGIAFRRGWHKKLLTRNHPAEVIPPTPGMVVEDYEMDIDFDVEDKHHLAQVNVHEEIELTTVAKQHDDLNLDEFEQELSNLEQDKKEALKKAPSKTISDLLNIGNLIDASTSITAQIEPKMQPTLKSVDTATTKINSDATQSTTAVEGQVGQFRKVASEKPEQLTDNVPESLDDKFKLKNDDEKSKLEDDAKFKPVEADIKFKLEDDVKFKPVEDNAKFKLEDDNSNLKFEPESEVHDATETVVEGEIIQESDPEINFDELELEIAKDDAAKAEQAKLMDNVIDDLEFGEMESNDFDSTQSTSKDANVAPEQQSNDVISEREQQVPESSKLKIEPGLSTKPTHSKAKETHKNIELKLEDDAPKNQKKEPVLGSELRLEPEGTELLSADEEANKLKIDLAKKYLDAGDKDTARALLYEVAASAKDSQKLEAEIILSGIL